MSFVRAMRKRWSLIAAIVVHLFAFSLIPLSAFAQLPFSKVSMNDAARRAKAKNILLVQGAWSDGSSFQKVIPLLQAEGFHVVSVQIPLTSFADDVAATRRALALEEGPVLLVGHSYGGAVITEVGNDPKVVGLVYLAAIAPEIGESTSSLLNSVAATPLFSELSQDSYGFLKVSEQGYLDDFVEGLPKREQKILAATQKPTNAASLGGVATVASWKDKPSWYIVTETDRAVATGLQRSMAKRISAATISVRSCHVVMLAHPDLVSAVVTLAALGFHWQGEAGGF